jgi:DNA-binding protein HU-beta
VKIGKNNIVAAVAETTGLKKAIVERVFDALLEQAADGIARGDEVSLPNLGTLSVIDRSARGGRNPRTGELIEIPASKSIKFKAYIGIKGRVNA